MPTYELVGTVKTVLDPQTFASGFSKREVVISPENERFPNDVPVSFAKDRAKLLDPLKPGDRVKIQFDLRGREYNGRYFVNCEGWKLEKADEDQPPAAPADSAFEQDIGAADDTMPF